MCCAPVCPNELQSLYRNTIYSEQMTEAKNLKREQFTSCAPLHATVSKLSKFCLKEGTAYMIVQVFWL